jgi:hypothetical protein
MQHILLRAGANERGGLHGFSEQSGIPCEPRSSKRNDNRNASHQSGVEVLPSPYEEKEQKYAKNDNHHRHYGQRTQTHFIILRNLILGQNDAFFDFGIGAIFLFPIRACAS